jgi:uncharacterized protein YbbC (DUF1343 family)
MEVVPGIEVLAADSAHLLRDMRVGLITNHTGRGRAGTSSAELLLRAGVDVAVLLSPEHGLMGGAGPGEAVSDDTDESTSLPVHSLYGERRKPDAALLAELDALVFDVQDIGARYYTYVSTMTEAMRAAAAHGLRFVVADRPNPIGGRHVQGNVLDESFASFVGPLPVAMRHGMTAGELALMFNAEADLGADLRVVPAAGWRRSLWFDDISIPWTPTSPNMPDLESASHYPGTCLFEGTGVSVGRGTNRPFQQLGAPWVDAEALKRAIDVHAIPGVQLEAVTFTPRGADDGKFEGVSVPGVRLQVADRSSYDPTRVALVLLVEMRAMAGPAWEWRPASFDRLAGTDRLRRDIEDGVPVATILDRWQGARVRFERTRAQYLLYP